jgi:hypothetical protein
MQAAAVSDGAFDEVEEEEAAAEAGDVITDLDDVMLPALAPAHSNGLSDKPTLHRMPSLELDIPGETDVDTMLEARGREVRCVVCDALLALATTAKRPRERPCQRR